MRKRNPLKVILKCALSPELLDCNELNSIFTAETDNLTSLSPKIFVNPFAPTNEIPSVLKNGWRTITNQSLLLIGTPNYAMSVLIC